MFRSNHLLIFAFLLVLKLPLVSSPAQESEIINDTWVGYLESRKQRFTYLANWNGSLQWRSDDPNIPFKLEDFFLNPVVISEIALDSSKQTSVKKRIARYQVERKKLIGRLMPIEDLGSGKRLAKFTSQARAELKRLQVALDEELNKMLGREKATRVAQIQLHFAMQQDGFFQTLRHPAVRKQFRIAFDRPEQLEQQKKLLMQLFKAERELTKRTIDHWLIELDDKQRARFDQRWPVLVKTRTSLECRLAQLNAQLDETIGRAPHKPVHLFDFGQPAVRMEVTGQFQFDFNVKRNTKLAELAKLRSVFYAFANSHFRRDLELDDSQIEEYNRIRQNWIELTRESGRRIGEKYGYQPRHLGEQQIVVYPINDPVHAREYDELLEKETGPFIRN